MIMYNMTDYDQPEVAALYFVFLILIGALFLVNLILAVVHNAFISIEHEELVRQFQTQPAKLDEAIDLLNYEASLFNENETDRVLQFAQ